MDLSYKNSIIIIFGLGYVGLPLAIEFGKRRPVIGFDTDRGRVAELKIGVDRTLEVEPEALKEARFLKLTADTEAIVEERRSSDPFVFILAVPTPVDKANRPDVTKLVKATEMVGSLLRNHDLVIYESTVYPGATEEVCAPVLSAISGLAYEKQIQYQSELLTNDTPQFFLGYSPERINPGDRTRTLTDVVKITSGSNPHIAVEVDLLYSEIIDAGTFRASSIAIAEAAKVIENSQRDINIAFVNELSMIFNRMGLDTQEVLKAAGTKWNFLNFQPGLVGGHCIGVDPYYLTYKAEQLGYHPEVILAGRRINDRMSSYCATEIIRMMVKNKIDVQTATIGIFGLTFKENCTDTRNSKAIELAEELSGWGLKVYAIDPWVQDSDSCEDYSFDKVDEFEPKSLHVCVFAVAHDIFKQMKLTDVRGLCRDDIKPIMADLKSIFSLYDSESLDFSVFRL